LIFFPPNWQQGSALRVTGRSDERVNLGPGSGEFPAVTLVFDKAGSCLVRPKAAALTHAKAKRISHN